MNYLLGEEVPLDEIGHRGVPVTVRHLVQRADLLQVELLQGCICTRLMEWVKRRNV
jgi:hypothetical protein